ncbi:MAG: CarD family transcriptional regulator, partial [Candidatus Auribacterota bacterium]|nr:CarD family transcriptional regulator [Candidatus Auribacterota bacterium]
MNELNSIVKESSEFHLFLSAWESGREVRVLRTPGSSPGFILARAYRHSHRLILVVTPDEKESEWIQRELEGFLGSPVFFFPAGGGLSDNENSPDPVIQGERQAILTRLIHKREPTPILIAPLSALKDDLPAPEDYEKSILEIAVGVDIEQGKLLARLVEQGYENQNPVMERGRFARRGGIVDIYPGNLDYPIRVEFEGDRVDSLREFDPQTQLSRGPVESLGIYPPAGKGRASLFDYLPDGCRLCRIGTFTPEAGDEFDRVRGGRAGIVFESDPGRTPVPEGGTELRFSISTLERFKYQDPGIKYPLLDMLTEWLSSGYRVLIYGHNPGETDRLKEILTEKGLYPRKNLQVLTGELEEGFIWEEARLVVVGDSEIFSRYRIPRPRRKYTAEIPALPRAEFRPGDFVVHLDHGIGKYLGIRKIRSERKEREMLVIGYAEGAKLYLSLTQSHLVSRYLGAGKANPKLDRLGGGRWLRAKVGAEQAVRDLAGDLLELQAHRAAARGHAFPPDNAWQKEFEAAFIYTETEEQARAIIEVKGDMEARRPMDRLLCGDVGYGKTEVAIRAAFKAVMDGRQAAVLVPTTILAQQHLRTFRDRVSDYPVRVEALSRLVSAKERKKIISDLATGTVDIVIGTHRLLQSDIILKNLGLVIIDEEQRFGVRHKEKLKKMKKLVDVLTLTATPIPRTLYLSLTGA